MVIKKYFARLGGINDSNRRNLRRLLCAAIFISLFSCSMYFKKTSEKFVSSESSSSFQRGKNLTFNICGQCHYDQTLNKFIGKHLNDLPKIAGALYSANLTQSKTHGIPPRYSDSELFYLLKTGISKNGKFMPYMMKPMMADEDINDIIIYLRSNDPAVAPEDTTVGKTNINFIGNIGIRFLAKPQPFKKGIPRPNESNAVSYGGYLVGVIGCYHCHSEKAGKLDYLNPEKTKGYLIGGMKLNGPNGRKLRASNLTPDKETGIGNYSLDDFRKAVRDGVAPSGDKLRPPMPKFAYLNDDQVNAIYVYLQNLTPVHHKVKK
jgi:mono/diheme cytochrome c family protein